MKDETKELIKEIAKQIDKEKYNLLLTSRWILYCCLGLLIIYIINIILNNYKINIQQVPFPN